MSNTFTKNNLNSTIKKLTAFQSNNKATMNLLNELRETTDSIFATQSSLIGEYETDCDFKLENVSFILRDTLIPLLTSNPYSQEF